jgi:hypothetical protein
MCTPLLSNQIKHACIQWNKQHINQYCRLTTILRNYQSWIYWKAKCGLFPKHLTIGKYHYTTNLILRYSLLIRKIWGKVLWKALPEHDPTKLDSTQNTNPTASDDFLKTNYTLCHFNYYCKIISPKIENPVSQARCHDILTAKIGFIHFDHTKLKICI